VSAPRAVIVVVPARNEEDLIGASLLALERAVHATRERLGAQAPTIDVVVVADHCTDATVAVADRFTGVHVLELQAGSLLGNVGTARAVGVTTGLERVAASHDQVWLAHTDADSRVPENWLLDQLELAAAGVDVMIGTVRPDFHDLPAAQVELWEATHTLGEPNGHVHGANLGIRASVYLAAGGFLPQAEHEDVGLVERALALGARSVAVDSCEVATSGRLSGRTPGGYAAHLRDQGARLAEDIPSTV
jgi:glycosyltransferase involved in cell wall biosynthesis